MSDKLSVHFWMLSASAEGQWAIGALIVIVVVVAVIMTMRKRA